MASRSANEPAHAAAIIPFIPRHRVRHCAHALVVALEANADRATVRRRIADARATFEEDLVAEVQRIIEHGSLAEARAGIFILLEIADAAAQVALWEIARTGALDPAVRLDALRGLCQQGAEVPMRQLVELANQCDRAPRPRDRDAP
jgi:hypothetical protein